MSKIFYIADWHYGHANCIRFDNRPFENLEQMNQELIDRWNSVVSNEDTVFTLGDMFFKCSSQEAQKVMDQLNGRVKILLGNHCRRRDINLINKFDSVHDYLEIQDKNRSVVLCHYPILTFKNQRRGWFHLYGHTHFGTDEKVIERAKADLENVSGCKCNMINVGCMMPWMDYTPRTLDEIIEGYNRYNEYK